jgi:hypothetical protein
MNTVTLRYLKGDAHTLAIKRNPWSIKHMRLQFTPLCEVDTHIAGKILRNPRFTGMFAEEFIPPPTFICETCGFSARHKLALLGHQRSHSTKIPHESRSTLPQYRRKPLTSTMKSTKKVKELTNE